MNNIKIAFFDIDGTLIAMDRDTMSELMEDTLLQLQKNGIILCIATGRPPRSVPQFPRVKFDAYLT
ncbi:MAG: HAD family hydrolase [[Clostridium] innocuum]